MTEGAQDDRGRAQGKIRPPRRSGTAGRLLFGRGSAGTAVGGLMIYLTFGLGGLCHDGTGLLAAGLGFALHLRHGRGIVAGLGMRPVGTRHTLLCHRITSGQIIAANR